MKDQEPGEGEGKRGPEGLRSYLRYLHLGTQMVVLILLGVFGGIWLDGRTGWSPALTVAGALLGIGMGLAVVIREVGGSSK